MKIIFSILFLASVYMGLLTNILYAEEITTSSEDKVFLETTLRENTEIMTEKIAPKFREQEQSPTRRVRSFPMQPPTIPHSIEGYVLTKELNQCLICHNGNVAPQMKAPAVGESHYANGDGEYLTNISPRRYFCTQCHVPQSVKKPLVENNFGVPGE
jgi:cytochrome c-type protein NapB